MVVLTRVSLTGGRNGSLHLNKTSWDFCFVTDLRDIHSRKAKVQNYDSRETKPQADGAAATTAAF